ncbi:MAG TPA: FTR1 family protein [Myxococcales bacterium]|jgi:high-affinity iron transporter
MILTFTLAAAAGAVQPSVAAGQSSPGGAVGQSSPAGAARPLSTRLRRAVALLDYVAADYPQAVGPNGEVLSPQEHEEQKGFVEDAAREVRTDAGSAGEPIARELDALSREVANRSPPAAVSARAKSLRDQIARTFHVVLAPSHPPDVAKGAQVYAESCAACHGADGHPNTALGLSTKPPDFTSREETSALTPQRIFAAATYGVPNTAMPSYEEGLTEDDRWNVAYYVLSLVPHDAVLAAGSSQGLGPTRSALSAAVGKANAGDRDGAREQLISAYLDDFEPHEAALRAKDAALVADIEGAFVALRAAVESGREVDAAAARLDGLLEKADARDGGGALVAFVAALAIALREGVEAALLVAAMLALLRKAGRVRDASAVHAGWIVALGAGGIAWWGSGAVLTHLSGAHRELAEGVLQLVTAALLLYASHWLLASLSAKRLVSFLSARTLAAGSAVAVFGLTFFAVFREMLEIVVFYRGLLLESAGLGGAVALGALAGVCVLAVLVALFQRLGRKLKPRPLLVTCGVLLCVLAVLMVGNGIRSLQVLGSLPMTVWGTFQLPALGVYATREGLLAQALVVIGLIASALWTAGRADRAPTTNAAASAR